jgi:glycosyltransferase involved in cell wall biosynthesis
MQILFITNAFPNPLQRTKGTYNLQLARGLAQEHTVRVIAPIQWTDEWQGRRKGQGSLNRERCEQIDGMEVHYPRYYYTPKILRAQYGWFFWQSVRRTGRRLLAAQRPDVILGYWAHPDGEAVVRLARQAQIPAAMVVGGSDVLLLTSDASRRRCVLRILEAMDAVVTVSGDLKAKLVGFGIDAQKIHTMSRGVDRERFAPGDRSEARRRLHIPADAKVLVWVGRMVPVKGLDILLDACAKLKERGVGFHLYLVGDGPLQSALEAQVQSGGLSSAVTFVGSVLHEQLADWYRAADYTVLTSHSEGVPNVLLESLACGTPFVASRVGGILELAKDACNRLVPPGDPEVLADALVKALAGPEAGSELAFQGPDCSEAATTLGRILDSLVSVTSEKLCAT